MHESWKLVLQDEMQKPYFIDLVKTLRAERVKGEVYPPPGKVFTAFEETPFDQVRVVILGQDPYHGFGQAHGMAFSVMPGVRVPPSLLNVYKELQADVGVKPVKHGYLVPWARQGVFLLNTVLTVRKGEPGSHRKLGWETFTDRVITELSKRDKMSVFVLWGKDAQSKAGMIDTSKHKVLTSVHPSPMSAHFGFFGSKPFSKVNEILLKKNLRPINWQLPTDPYGTVPDAPEPEPVDEDVLDLDALLSGVEEF